MANNVDRLKQAGVLHPQATLEPHHEDAINKLSNDEIETVLHVHGQVGTIEVKGDPKGRMFIF